MHAWHACMTCMHAWYACIACMHDTFGVTLESLSDHFGVTLRSLWDHFEIILGSLWDHFGTTLGPLWDHFGTTLGPLWDDFGLTLGSLRGHFGVILGSILRQFWGYPRCSSWTFSAEGGQPSPQQQPFWDRGGSTPLGPIAAAVSLCAWPRGGNPPPRLPWDMIATSLPKLGATPNK